MLILLSVFYLISSHPTTQAFLKDKLGLEINLMKQKYVLNSVASFKDINSSSLNKSSTKQTFSFGKTSRFDSFKPLCEKSSYGGDFIQHKVSGAGIGYGKRSDFTQCKTSSPAATKYCIQGQFETNKRKLKGNTMGLGREVVVFNQYVGKQGAKLPSSTHYHIDKIDRNRAPSFSLRSKTKVLDRSMTLDPERENPGPGSYHQLASSKRVSKFAQVSFGTARSKRFSSSSNNIPGVGQYNNHEPISGTGTYNVSKHTSCRQAKFAKTPRVTFFDNANLMSKQKPGPGSYKQPSEFGQYDGNVYGETAIRRFSRQQL